MTGGQIHRAVVAHLRARAHPDALWFHVPNGGQRSRVTGAILKALGVLRGVADILIIFRSRVYALELKSKKGRPTVEQMEFMSRLTHAGGYGCITQGLDRALAVLERWGVLR